MLNKLRDVVFSSAVVLFLSAGFSAVYAADMKPEDVISRHLDSIGTAEVRTAAKSRAVQGQLKFRILVGGGGETTGTWGRVSQQRQSKFVMRFGLGDWRGEQFVFNGQKTSFAAATDTHRRSAFGQFVSSQDFVIKEGLLGGELSTGWALQNLNDNPAKLVSLGRKKVDGRDLVGVQYFSKGTSDMQVKIYFDPETYRHVLTVYTLEAAPNMGGTVTNSVFQQQIRYTMEERFSDFKTADGLTLPGRYDLQYTQELQTGTTLVYDWDMTVNQLGNNISLDPVNFQVK